MALNSLLSLIIIGSWKLTVKRESNTEREEWQMLRVIAYASLIVLGVSFTDAAVLAEHVSVQGYVRDEKTGEPLLGATVMLVGTSLGAATDVKGKYIIPSVPPGKYT